MYTYLQRVCLNISIFQKSVHILGVSGSDVIKTIHIIFVLYRKITLNIQNCDILPIILLQCIIFITSKFIAGRRV